MNLKYALALVSLPMTVVYGYRNNLRRGSRWNRNIRNRNNRYSNNNRMNHLDDCLEWCNDSYGDGYCCNDVPVQGNKMNAAQKRQNQRDANRMNPNHPSYNPFRDEFDEHGERLRKHRQADRIGNPDKDPYEPFHGTVAYARKREVARQNRCYDTGEHCDFEALHYDDFGPYAEGHRARDYDDVHDIDYGPWDYGVGDAWFPEDDNGDFWFL
eukprot:622391_1